ncbi:diguanylate cyclase [Gorillibacterium timonense]|uniref:diguanylate cyclase n=1 Tax=Gorillibacterium timonense TaxID=1689269 RepID=UPI00071CAD95|nr:diguanylate cyclase [Gorillibacterium timonense]
MNGRIDQAPCGYLLLTKQGMIQEANHTFLSWMDYEHSELVNQHIEKCLSAASRIIFHSLFVMGITSGGRVEETYLTLRTKQDQEVPILLNGRLVKIDGTEHIDCIAVRITKRNDYEHELQTIKAKLEEAYRLKNEVLEKESKLRELLETTLFSINEGIIVTNNQGIVTLMNPLAETYTGWTSEEAKGKEAALVFRCKDFHTGEDVDGAVNEVIRTGRGLDLNDHTVLVAHDGTERLITGTSACITSKDGTITGTVTSFRDITKEYLQEKEIDSFLNVNMDMLCVFDRDTLLHKVNIRFEEVLGYKTEELIGKNFLSFVHMDDIGDTMAVIKDLTDRNTVSGFTNRFRCKDGSYRYLEWRAQPGVGPYIYSSARDITETVLKEENLQRIAVKDELTGLYNRHYFAMILKGEMDKADASDQRLSLAIMDLDHFKRVNDTWGHPVGDELLMLTAETAGRNLRKSDLLIRFGGEEFVVLMPNTEMEGAVKALEKVRLALVAQDHPLTGKQTVSIGIAEKRMSESFQDWYKRADEALYRAKQEGRNRVETG